MLASHDRIESNTNLTNLVKKKALSWQV